MSIHITPVKTETYIPSKVKDEERKPEEKPMVSSKALAVSLTALGVASLGLLAVKIKRKVCLCLRLKNLQREISQMRKKKSL